MYPGIEHCADAKNRNEMKLTMEVFKADEQKNPF